MFKKRFFSPKLLAIVFLNLFLIGLPLIFVLAQGAGWGDDTGAGWGDTLGIENPLRADSFTELFVGITNWVAGAVAMMAVLVVVIGGYQYMTSGGNEEKTAAARRTIQWALIGLIIVLASWSLLRTLLTILGVE